MTEAKCLRSVGKGAPRRSPDGSRSARPAATRAAEDLSIIAKGAMSYFPRPAPFDAAVHPPTVAGLRCWQRALPPSHGKTSRSSWPKIRSPWFGDQLGECLADHSRAPARRCWLTASLLSWRPFSARWPAACAAHPAAGEPCPKGPPGRRPGILASPCRHSGS